MDPSTRARLAQHVVAAQAVLYGNISGGIFQITPDWARGFSGLPWPTFNIFMPRTMAGLTDDTLADAAAFFDDKKVLYAIELVHDRFPEGPDLLDKRHYQSLPPQPAMVLEDFPEEIQINPDIYIEPVRTVPALTAFCTLQHQVFDFPLPDMVKLFPVAHVKDTAIQHFLAFIDEQPVGTSTMILADGVASFWNLCTVDSHRRQGVATTLLHRMMREVWENYDQLAMLYSTAQAYSLFSKFGFEIYTQRQWFLPPGIDYGSEE